MGPSSISHLTLLSPFLAKFMRPLALKEHADQVRDAGGGRAIDFLLFDLLGGLLCAALVIVKKRRMVHSA